jgi:myosin-1
LGSLAKALYDNLFNWLVAKMNESILPEDTKNKMTIGLLDIFGFENFQVN